MEEVGKSTPGDSSETDLLEMSQIAIRQLKESRTREMKLQEEIRILKKQHEIQNGPAATNQQHGVQELHQQITELTQQFRQLKSVSDEKVQRLSNEVARLEVEAKDKDAKIKDMADRENVHQSAIGDTRTTTPMNELRNSLADENQASERDPSERRLPRGFNGQNTANDDAHDDDEQTTLMDELRDRFATNARDFLSRMDQMARSIHGDEDSGGRACLQSPAPRARRASAVDVRADAVSRREESDEDLQKKLDKLADVSEKRLKYIRLMERERSEMDRKLDEADAQLKSMRAESEARDQQLENWDDRERDRLNAATLELKAQLQKANKENEHLARDLDQNEWRLANTREALDEAEKRIRETGTADAERKLKEYEEKCVELRRRQREIDDLRVANEYINVSAAQAISEKESAVERIAEIAAELRTERSEKGGLQTRIRHLEDDNKRLKEHGKQVEESLSTDVAELESACKVKPSDITHRSSSSSDSGDYEENRMRHRHLSDTYEHDDYSARSRHRHLQ